MALGKNLKKREVKKQLPVVEQKSNPKEPLKKEQKAPEKPQNVDQNKGKQAYLKATNQYCVFKAGNEEYAIPIEIVKEVVPVSQITSVPHMPNFIKGMTNVRGTIYGVLDVSSFFRHEADSDDQKKYILILEHDVFHMSVCIPEVPDTLAVSDDMIESLSVASGLKSVIGQEYLRGIIKKDNRMIILIDLLGIIAQQGFAEVG